jgi:hypothetical protein
MSVEWDDKCKALNAQLQHLIAKHNELELAKHKAKQCTDECSYCKADDNFQALADQLSAVILSNSARAEQRWKTKRN